MPTEPLDAARSARQTERLEWDVRRAISVILSHRWIPSSATDAIRLRGFIDDVDTGKLEEVSCRVAIGSIG